MKFLIILQPSTISNIIYCHATSLNWTKVAVNYVKYKSGLKPLFGQLFGAKRSFLLLELWITAIMNSELVALRQNKKGRFARKNSPVQNRIYLALIYPLDGKSCVALFERVDSVLEMNASQRMVIFALWLIAELFGISSHMTTMVSDETILKDYRRNVMIWVWHRFYLSNTIALRKHRLPSARYEN